MNGQGIPVRKGEEDVNDDARPSATLTDTPAQQAPRRPMPLMAALVAFALTSLGAIVFGLATPHTGDGTVEVAAIGPNELR